MTDDSTRTREEALLQRDAIRERYGELYSLLSNALFEADPMGINFVDNTDEYEPEVDTILPRLNACHGAGDVQIVVHEEFGRWFGQDIAGEFDHYEDVALKIWKLILPFRSHLLSV